MDLYYYKLFYPDIIYKSDKELFDNLELNRDNVIYSIKKFYDKYPYFNIIEYKKLNNILQNYNNLETMVHYHNDGIKNIYLSSLKEFNLLYPDFDIIFYKIFYHKNIDDISNNFKIINNYHHKDKYVNNITCIKEFTKIYDIDFTFMKKLYNIFTYSNEIEIVKTIIKNNNLEYIYSEKDFYRIYNEFNLKIYKAFNYNLEFEEDIKYINHWFNIGKDSFEISSINQFYEKYDNFNIELYKYIYNISNNISEDTIIIEWYNRIDKEKLIYSTENFINTIDDFNYNLFKKHNIIIKNKKNNEIIDFYIKNIKNINIIYSEKLFYIKYPFFNLNEYLKFNKHIISNINLKIINEYYTLKDKDNIIISIKDFYSKYPSFKIEIYKNFLNNCDNIFLDNDEEYIYHWYYNNRNNNSIYSVNSFNKFYSEFNSKIYNYFNNLTLLELDNIDILTKLYESIVKDDSDIVYSIKTFYKKYSEFNKKIYISFNNLEDYPIEEVIINWHINKDNHKLIYSEKSFYENESNFDINIYRELNNDLKDLKNEDLIIHWFKYSTIQNRIYSIQSFYDKYPELDFNINSKKYNFDILNSIDGNNYNESEKIIYWTNIGIYNYQEKHGIIGRHIVNTIYEALIDLSNSYPKNNLKKGISLIIRAKNEELNIKDCIETVVDLVDEIIFVDNGSTDSTYDIVKKYCEIYKNIKLYKYNISVSKVGIDHQEAIKNNNKNTLGTFYNWCLSKATFYNVFKWDADFICIRNNFIELVNKFKVKERDDKYAIWFTGKTLFENNQTYYLNSNSFYNEYRIFSYFNNFKWYDGNTCEYTEPYLESIPNNKKIRYLYPLFYEVKRTSLDEFKERSSLIDDRDKNDFNILNNLKSNRKLDLINIDHSLINSNIKIIIYTPSLSLGGGNQFIINIYEIYKNFGFKVIIVPLKTEKIGNDKYNNIMDEDIYDFKNFNINFIKIYKPNYIIFNSDVHFNSNDLDEINKLTKLVFITHSDVAYSNYFIEKYYNYFNKILTVNKYTQTKLINLLNIKESNKFRLINNYSNIKKKNKIFSKNGIKKKTFGIISRFSEDKNIPMFINSLVNVLNNYPDYKCYLVGTENEYYDNFLKKLSKLFKLDKNIYFEGYQSDTIKYYELFDFIVLPSVSEGCSYNIIEAMTLGVPIVISDVGGNHELIKNDINGILYSYTKIKEYERSNIYIENYNEILSNIGYCINNTFLKNNYTVNFDIRINNSVIMPTLLECKKHNIYNNNCKECNILKDKQDIFHKNMNNISSSIIKMIEYNNLKIMNFINNNEDFINTKFNENIYINQVLDIIKN
jgi:glycosyltransferase involved in cell wall biosynthesis